MGFPPFPVVLENLISCGLYTTPHLIFRAPSLDHNGVGSVPCGLPYTNCLTIYHGLSGSSGNCDPCFVCIQVFLNQMWRYTVYLELCGTNLRDHVYNQ